MPYQDYELFSPNGIHGGSFLINAHVSQIEEDGYDFLSIYATKGADFNVLIGKNDTDPYKEDTHLVDILLLSDGNGELQVSISGLFLGQFVPGSMFQFMSTLEKDILCWALTLIPLRSDTMVELRLDDATPDTASHLVSMGFENVKEEDGSFILLSDVGTLSSGYTLRLTHIIESDEEPSTYSEFEIEESPGIDLFMSIIGDSSYNQSGFNALVNETAELLDRLVMSNLRDTGSDNRMEILSRFISIDGQKYSNEELIIRWKSKKNTLDFLLNDLVINFIFDTQDDVIDSVSNILFLSNLLKRELDGKNKNPNSFTTLQKKIYGEESEDARFEVGEMISRNRSGLWRIYFLKEHLKMHISKAVLLKKRLVSGYGEDSLNYAILQSIKQTKRIQKIPPRNKSVIRIRDERSIFHSDIYTQRSIQLEKYKNNVISILKAIGNKRINTDLGNFNSPEKIDIGIQYDKFNNLSEYESFCSGFSTKNANSFGDAFRIIFFNLGLECISDFKDDEKCDGTLSQFVELKYNHISSDIFNLNDYGEFIRKRKPQTNNTIQRRKLAVRDDITKEERLCKEDTLFRRIDDIISSVQLSDAIIELDSDDSAQIKWDVFMKSIVNGSTLYRMKHKTKREYAMMISESMYLIPEDPMFPMDIVLELDNLIIENGTVDMDGVKSSENLSKLLEFSKRVTTGKIDEFQINRQCKRAMVIIRGIHSIYNQFLNSDIVSIMIEAINRCLNVLKIIDRFNIDMESSFVKIGVDGKPFPKIKVDMTENVFTLDSWRIGRPIHMFVDLKKIKKETQDLISTNKISVGGSVPTWYERVTGFKHESDFRDHINKQDDDLEKRLIETVKEMVKKPSDRKKAFVSLETVSIDLRQGLFESISKLEVDNMNNTHLQNRPSMLNGHISSIDEKVKIMPVIEQLAESIPNLIPVVNKVDETYRTLNGTIVNAAIDIDNIREKYKFISWFDRTFRLGR